jgi:hypothetical protein
MDLVLDLYRHPSDLFSYHLAVTPGQGVVAKAACFDTGLGAFLPRHLDGAPLLWASADTLLFWTWDLDDRGLERP